MFKYFVSLIERVIRQYVDSLLVKKSISEEAVPETEVDDSIPSGMDFLTWLEQENPFGWIIYINPLTRRIGVVANEGSANEIRCVFYRSNSKLVCEVVMGTAPPLFPLVVQYQAYARESGDANPVVEIEIRQK